MNPGPRYEIEIHMHYIDHVFLSLFILRERERERERTSGGGAEREGEKERIPSRLHTVSMKPSVGLEPMNREITT